jgi:hypothetical protein
LSPSRGRRHRGGVAVFGATRSSRGRGRHLDVSGIVLRPIVSIIIEAMPLALRRLGHLKARGITSRLEASLQGQGPHFEVGGIPSRSTSSSLRQCRCLWGGRVVSKSKALSLRRRCCRWRSRVVPKAGVSPGSRRRWGGAAVVEAVGSPQSRGRHLEVRSVTSRQATSLRDWGRRR